MTKDLKVSPTGNSSYRDQQEFKIMSEIGQTKLPIKRSFDVAFLMLPDEKLKQRNIANSSPELDKSMYPLAELSVRSDLLNRYHHKMINSSDTVTSEEYLNANKLNENRFYSGSLNSSSSSDKSEEKNHGDIPKSAFSKVTQILNVDSSISPPISPDHLSCSSASPPISYSPPSVTFRSDYNHFLSSSAFQAIDQSAVVHQGKLRQLMYRNSSSEIANFNKNNCDNGPLQNFQFGPPSNHAAVFMSQPEQFIRNPAAAILSTLLPTTLGALSLPAQNVCAKCNISFRMTSDLVYHMRSHHKNENVQDPNRRKREEKLKCPVCSESFRERHHLTRHMTAHQDKEGDLLDHEVVEYSRRK